MIDKGRETQCRGSTTGAGLHTVKQEWPHVARSEGNVKQGCHLSLSLYLSSHIISFLLSLSLSLARSLSLWLPLYKSQMSTPWSTQNMLLPQAAGSPGPRGGGPVLPKGEVAELEVAAL